MTDFQLGFSFRNSVAVQPSFPSTRYQGSKRAIAEWIWSNVGDLPFESVLDVFGGTGAVSYRFKQARKRVTYNDYLKFNWYIGLALIENSSILLEDNEVELLQTQLPHVEYCSIIQDTFDGIYYTAEENAWLDRVVQNIDAILIDPYKRAIAFFALFQACMAKRPYNLFHRANLYMRTSEVKRTFGNKATWDTPFPIHFRHFVGEANRAVFDNGRANQAIQLDALSTPAGADLVYIDPPYVNRKGIGVNYRDFYHFVEGLTDYTTWCDRIDKQSRHRRLMPVPSLWSNSKTIANCIEKLVMRHQESIIVLSYRDDGVPSRDELVAILSRYKQNVRQVTTLQKYVLANSQNNELLLIAH